MLTHCNAGALATAGYGTALGGDSRCRRAGQDASVLADETRPFLQGARLTAWELQRDGIDTTVITDNMSGALMRGGRSISWSSAPTGSRPTATWRTRSAPTAWRCSRRSTASRSTSPRRLDDRSRDAGRIGIPIEERNAKEVTHLGRPTRLTPEGASVHNPAFDVTPHKCRDRHHHRTASLAPYSESLPNLVNSTGCEGPSSWHLCVMLGIETSCDETSAAVVSETRGGAWTIGSNIVASQVAIHREWGGVVPSSRRASTSVTSAAWSSGARHGERRAFRSRCDCRHARARPGRIAAGRRVVREVARAVAGSSARAGAPSGRSHRVAVSAHGDLPLPLVALVVSGGHTRLYLVNEPGRRTHRPDAG